LIPWVVSLPTPGFYTVLPKPSLSPAGLFGCLREE